MFNQEFGILLSEGLSAAARRRKITMGEIEADLSLRVDEAGYELSPNTSAGWRRGYIPKEPEQIELLAKYCISCASMQLDWAREFLIQARYPHH